MTILAWIILGAVAGWFASLILNTDYQKGILLNIIVGIIGALLGGLTFTFFGGVTDFNFYSLIVALVGSILFIGILKAIRG